MSPRGTQQDRWKPPSPWVLALHKWARFFAAKLPWTALVLVVALTLWAAFVLLPTRPALTSDEIQKLKQLAASSGAAKEQPQSGDDKEKATLTPDEVQALKGLAKESKSLDNLAGSSKDIIAGKGYVEQVEKSKEDVKGFLEWVIGIAGFFTIAQAVAAGFAAQSFTGQAERDIEELDNFKKDYGVIAVAGQAQMRAFDTLKELFIDGSWPDWRTKLYSTMDQVKRQSVLSADRYLGFDLLLEGRGREISADISGQQRSTLRGLANFYASKFEHEKKLRSAQWQDLERAHHLLQSWINSHPSDFAVHNDLGMVFCNCANYCREIKDHDREKSFRRCARVEFDTSLFLKPDQQRAYFNLSFVASDMDKPVDWPASGPTAPFEEGLKLAVEMLRRGLQHRFWEIKANVPMETEFHYNLACLLALQCYCAVCQSPPATPKGEISSSTAKDVFTELDRVAASDRGTILKRYVDSDYKDGGDLWLLNSRLDSAGQLRLAHLQDALSANAPKEEDPTCSYADYL